MAMTVDEAERVERVRSVLRDLGHDSQVMVSDASTHTAAMAAEVAGCELGQIVKTLVVYVSGKAMLALVSGDRRLDDRLLAARFEVGRKQIKLADGHQVLELTGYPVGGVSPFGLPAPMDALIDEGLARFDVVWIAAGTPSAILPIELAQLVSHIGGQYAQIAS